MRGARMVRIDVSGTEMSGKSTIVLLIAKLLNEQGFDCKIRSPLPNRSVKAVAEAAKALSERGLTVELYEVHRDGRTDVD